MAAVSGFGQDAGLVVANGLFHVGNDGRERVAIVRRTGQRHGMQGDLAAFRAGKRRRHLDLEAEFVRPARLAFANALDLVGVQAVDFVAAFTLLLVDSNGFPHYWV